MLNVQRVHREVNPDTRLIVCIDVSRDWLDGFAIHRNGNGEHASVQIRCKNQLGPIEQQLKELDEYAAQVGLEGLCVVCEPTGNFERKVFETARQLGHQTAYVNSEHVAKLSVIESGDTGEGALWEYNSRVMEHFGARYAALDVYNVFTTAYDLDDLMSLLAALPTGKLSEALYSGSAQIGLALKLRTAVKSFGHWGTLYDLWETKNLADRLLAHYEAYPDSPDGFEVWRSRRDDIMDDIYAATGAAPSGAFGASGRVSVLVVPRPYRHRRQVSAGVTSLLVLVRDGGRPSRAPVGRHENDAVRDEEVEVAAGRYPVQRVPVCHRRILPQKERE